MQFTEDIRYSLRQFAHAPGFTATAVLTLALGIGATTAIFTLIHVVLLKSLPVAKPSELYRVGDNENCCVNGGLQDNWSLFSYDKYKTFRDNTTGFTELAAFQAGRGLKGIRRAGTFPCLALASYSAWQQKYGRDPSVIGAGFTFNGQPVTVVGIMPPGFNGDRIESVPAFWIPLEAARTIDGAADMLDFPDSDWLDITGRLAPGADPKSKYSGLLEKKWTSVIRLL